MKSGGFDGGLELSDRSELTDTDVVAQVMYAPRGMDASQLPVRAFEKAFGTCYSSLAGAPIGTFEALRIIQDLASESTTLWMRLKLAPAALAAEDAAAMQLTFLARGTLTILGWLATAEPAMPDLCRAIEVLANGTLPSQSRVPAQRDLVRAIGALQDLRPHLPNTESVKILMHRGAAELDPLAPPVDLEKLLSKTVLQSSDGEMILIVEKPDYSAVGTWQLRHGSQRLEARCQSGAIAEGFYRRTVDIRPGDALRCRVQTERSYDSDNELLSEHLNIVEILSIASSGLAAPGVAEAQAPNELPEARPGNGNLVEQVEGDFVLTLREIPIH